MAELDLTAFSAALKIDYEEAVKEAIVNSTFFLKWLDRVPMVSKTKQIDIEMGRNASAGSALDGATLVANDYAGHDDATVTAKFNYAGVQITGPTLAASKSSAGAVVEAMANGVSRAKKDLQKELNRQLFGSGTGQLTTVTTGAASATQTVGNTKYLYPRRKIYFVTAGVEREVLSVTNSTTVVLTASVTSTTGEVITHSGAQGGSADIVGIDAAVDDGTVAASYEGITRSGNTFWQSYRLDNSGGGNIDITLENLSTTITNARANGGHPDVGMTTFGVMDTLGAILESDKRFVNTMVLEGGWEAINYKGVPIAGDVDCTDNSLYLIDKTTMALGVLEDFNFTPVLKVSGKDSYESTLKFYGNLIGYNCLYNAVMKEIQ